MKTEQITECTLDTPLTDALAEIGTDPELRERFIEACIEAEQRLAAAGRSVRDEVTGPLVDALHRDVGILRKKLSTGTLFDFRYRSKIAREFAMSRPSVPDHVWEPQTTKLLVYLAGTARTAVIGGAYFGDQAVLVAGAMAPRDGTCHAFEPNREQYEMLVRNVKLNGLRNVRMWSVGLWKDSTSRMRLVGDDSFAYPELIDDGGEDGFPTVTIDDYLADQGFAGADLIMLDIEGAEYGALQGARRQLERPAGEAPNVVFEVHRHYVDWTAGLEHTDIVRFMRSFGYTVWAVRDFNANIDVGDIPVELVPPERTYLDGPPHGFNMLAVKQPEIIDDPRFRICTDVSPKLLPHKDPQLHHPTDWL